MITADVKDFASLDESRHEGVFFLDNQRAPTHRIADATLDIIEAYGSPEDMSGKIENLDQWIR